MTGTNVASDRAALTPGSAALRAIGREDPERVAIELPGGSVSYAALDRDVDALSHRLTSEYGPDRPAIGMRLTTLHAMTTATLAIQRAGMVGVPIDPTAPIDRVIAVLNEISPAMVLSDVEGDGEALPVPVEHPLEVPAAPPAADADVEPDDTSAVVFTSGSTGTPKGIVMAVGQRAQASLVISQIAADYDLTDLRIGTIVVGTVGASDALIHSGITLGATLVGYEIRRRGLSEFAEWLRAERISAVLLVPTIWRFLAPELTPEVTFPALRLVVLSGETSTWQDVASLREHLSPDATISNMFGLTEVMISRFDIPSDMALGTGPLPAGTPFPGRTVTIVDEAGEAVAEGIDGEITVTCADCALGYWRQPEATARVFTRLADGRTRVRTGDGGRLLPDGTLIHLGRLDQVVKVAGNRIELGDLESALRSLPGVANAAATTYRSSNDETRLVAFAVAQAGASLHPELLRSALARRLPSPMVPDAVHLIDEIPQLAGGKVDRARLPDRAGARSGPAGSASPTSALEAELVEIFREVLGVSHVGVHDDFFALGGDSLRAARLVAAIEHRLGLGRPVAVVLEAPTVSMLANVLERGSDPSHTVVPLQLGGSRPPLIVVHDGKGDVFYAQRLVPHLGPDQPVYGLLPPSVDVEGRPERTLEEVAEGYVERIRSLCPSGPYLFYGYSLGGSIAFEMARQLAVSGEDVRLVGLGDAIGPGHPGVLPRRHHLTVRAKRRIKLMQPMGPTEAVRDVADLLGRKVRQHLGLQGPSAGVEPTPEEDPRIVKAFFEWYVRLAINYVPASRLRSDVLLIRAFDFDNRRDRGWGPFIDGQLTAVDVFDGHDRLHAPENTPAIGAALREAIDRVLVAVPATCP